MVSLTAVSRKNEPYQDGDVRAGAAQESRTHRPIDRPRDECREDEMPRPKKKIQMQHAAKRRKQVR